MQMKKFLGVECGLTLLALANLMLLPQSLAEINEIRGGVEISAQLPEGIGQHTCSSNIVDLSPDSVRSVLSRYRLDDISSIDDGPLPADDCCRFERDEHCIRKYFCRTTYDCGRIFQRHRWYTRLECERKCNGRIYYTCTEWVPTIEGQDDVCCQWSKGYSLPSCRSVEPNPVYCEVAEVEVR